MKYYTIFLGKKLWTNVIDDMNSREDWSIGGMLWRDKKHAIACMNNLKHPAYEHETKTKKFKIVMVLI